MRQVLLAFIVAGTLVVGCATTAGRGNERNEDAQPCRDEGDRRYGPDKEAPQIQPEHETESITICSFNIQFLGNPKNRENQALADVVQHYDIVLVQELVAPPYSGTFPDGTSYRPDPEAAEFFDAMTGHGFAYWLSEEDTGPGDQHHVNSAATEWWVAFYKPGAVARAPDLPHGFLADDRTGHSDYERVPYAFSFRIEEGRTDFVLISVHLKPDPGAAGTARRAHELQAISRWIAANSAEEKDFIIVGDMNIQNAGELGNATPRGYLSLNDQCTPTNTNVNGPRAYDHVMYSTTHSTEVDQGFGFVVVDLVEAVRASWSRSGPFPGDPYDHNRFRAAYSDHHPVLFQIRSEVDDD